MCKIAHWAGLKMCKILGRPPVKQFPFTLVHFAKKSAQSSLLTTRATYSIIILENKKGDFPLWQTITSMRPSA